MTPNTPNKSPNLKTLAQNIKIPSSNEARFLEKIDARFFYLPTVKKTYWHTSTHEYCNLREL